MYNNNDNNSNVRSPPLGGSAMAIMDWSCLVIIVDRVFSTLPQTNSAFFIPDENHNVLRQIVLLVKGICKFL